MNRVLVSYPKSGNTWLKFILCSLHKPKSKIDFNKAIKMFPSRDNPSEMKVANKNPIGFKQHSTTFNNDDRFVCLVRNPFDVLVSYWHHEQKFSGYEWDFYQFCEDQNFGQGWHDHTKHWLNCAVKIVTYESLLDYPLDIVTGICEYFEWDFSSEDIQAAIKKCTFKKMQNLEKKSGLGSIYSDSDESKLFVRSGKTNYNIPEDLKAKILATTKHTYSFIYDS